MSMVIFIILGLVGAIFQLTILRELIFSIAKNEFSFVISLGVWLIFCSLGAFTGRFRKKELNIIGPLLFSFVFCLSLAAIHLAKGVVGSAYYETASLVFVLLTGVLFVGPSAFLVGYYFCQFTKNYIKQKPQEISSFSKFFAYDAVGFFLGAVLFGFFLSSYSNPFYFSLLPLLFLFFLPARKRKKAIAGLSIVIISLLCVLSYPALLEREFKGASITSYQGTRYGPFITAKQYDTEVYYSSGSLISSSEDSYWHEVFIHTSLSTIKTADNILFIGPVFPGQLKELYKYPFKNLDCVSLNPVISEFSKNTLSSSELKRVNFIVDDPRDYIRKTAKCYDLIIMNMSPPLMIAYNRYYSRDFFELIRKKLSLDGVFSFSMPSKRDILSPRYVQFNSCIVNTIRTVFKSQLLIPSDSAIVLASDRNDIAIEEVFENFTLKSIATEYLTSYHFQDLIDPERIDYIEAMIDGGVPINTDDNSLGFLYYSLLEQAQFYPDLPLFSKNVSKVLIGIFIGISLILVLFTFVFPRSLSLVQASLFGFVSIGIMSTSLIMFQVSSGMLFWKLGLLVGIFMMGMGSTIFFINNLLERVKFRRLFVAGLYGVWLIILFSIFIAAKNLTYISGDFVFFCFSLLSGVSTGAMYPILLRLIFREHPRHTMASVSIYCADLFGAFLGTIIVSLLFIPFLGIQMTLILLIFLVCVFGLRFWLS
jgi:spermidine synthase